MPARKEFSKEDKAFILIMRRRTNPETGKQFSHGWIGSKVSEKRKAFAYVGKEQRIRKIGREPIRLVLKGLQNTALAECGDSILMEWLQNPVYLLEVRRTEPQVDSKGSVKKQNASENAPVVGGSVSDENRPVGDA